MAAIGAATGRWRDQARDVRRTAGQFLAGPGLWLAIGAFAVWAFAQERDALAVGVVAGSIFALGALGITLIYGILKFGHFAHGDSMMLAAYIAFYFLTGTITGADPGTDVDALPFDVGDLPGATDRIWRFSFGYGLLVSMALAAVVTALVFAGLDRAVYRRLRQRKSGIVMFSIAALGLAIAIRSVIQFLWGPTPRLYSPGIRKSVDLPFDITVLADQVFIFAAALVMAALVYALLFRTKLGRAMRATADNADLARISGIDTDRIILWTWVVSGGLVAVAGVLLALQAQLSPELGFILLLPLFASAILGGLGSPQGALLGGLIVGIFQEVAVTFDFGPVIEDIIRFTYFDRVLDLAGIGADVRPDFPGPGYKFSVAFLLLILILLVRPRGLFGSKG